MLISSLCGYLPPALSISFTIDATWTLYRWHLVQLPSSRDPATKAPVTALYLRGRCCTAAPNALNRATTHVPQSLLQLVRRLRASLALTDREVALLTEQARGGVRQV